MTTPSVAREQMNIVIVGHVDHGKSTLVGRLMADTGSLPTGKLKQVKATCQQNSKPFEYAFLLDALKDEQAQGITIDVARCFFKTKKRDYIILDAPGHIEFLKNMITGAARAEAALLLIDANEGIQENSRRHGYMLSMLGIKQVVVVVNKMDLVGYSESRFNEVKETYSQFLKQINVTPLGMIPISAFNGDNLMKKSPEMPWYTGSTIVDFMDGFEQEKDKKDQPLRFPVQDIYKFTEHKDDRRIIAGTVDAGELKVGDDVVFYPSLKESAIKSIEGFNIDPLPTINAGQATGLTMTTQLYIKPGELMVKKGDPFIQSGTTFKAHLFWLGKNPMVQNKKYKIKVATGRAIVYLKEIKTVLDASNLSSSTHARQINRHDVAECVLQTIKPIAFDCSSHSESTGRFVLVDGYEIAGGGIITDALADASSRLDDEIKHRDALWQRSSITRSKRGDRLSQKPKLIMISGPEGVGKIILAKALEESLFKQGKTVYYLGLNNIINSASDLTLRHASREELVHRLGETAYMMTEAGLIVIATLSDLDDNEAGILKKLNAPNDIVVINRGESLFSIYPVDYQVEEDTPHDQVIRDIQQFMAKTGILLEYSI
jgi:bifunctional enzyme CysN/CysC